MRSLSSETFGRGGSPRSMPMRHLFFLVAILLAGWIGCTHPKETPPATQASNQPPLPTGPVAAIWYDVGYPPPGFTGEMNKLIVGVWGDGTIVWSDDRAGGGK